MKQIWHYFIYCWKNSFNYQGRARRKEFLSFMLLNLLLIALCFVMENYLLAPLLGEQYPQNFVIRLFYDNHHGHVVSTTPVFIGLSLFWAVVSMFPTLALTARRYHDLNKSGWWQIPLTPPVFLNISAIAFFIHNIFIYIAYLLFVLYQLAKLFFQEGENEDNRFGKSPK